MDPQQLALNNSFADVPLVVDSIDCICGMTIPPPPPPPSSSAAYTITSNTATVNTTDTEEANVFTIQCDDCGRWLHGSCVGLTPDDVIPDNFSCPKCAEQRPSPAATPTPSSGSVGRPRKTRTLSNLEEYAMTNQVASDASSALKLLMLQYEELLENLPKDHASLASFNYEFAGECIAVPEEYDIRQLDKAIDVREIRSRGGQPKKGAIKKGLFVAQSVEPGQAICEFCGHVMRIETLFSRIHRVTTVQQSFVLFPVTKADVIIDARKHGSPSRWIRRSCRPNSTVKSVIQGHDVHWFIFAKHALKPGDELFLPLDWDAGNRFFRYECACNSPDTCLAPDELLPESFRDNLLIHREQMDAVSPLENHAVPIATVFTPSSSSSVDHRKMSREEKKLQRYIEAIERMENAERKRSRSTPSSSPETKESRRPAASPQKKPSKPAVPLKKAWAQKIEAKINFSSSSPTSSGVPQQQHQQQREEAVLEEEEENIDVETMDDDARDVATPVSQMADEQHQQQSESATKRLSLSDYLHRRQLSVTSEPTSSPLKEQLQIEREEEVEEELLVSDDRLSDASNASRESGEYIEAPIVHLPPPPINSSNSPPPPPPASTRYSNNNSGYYYNNNYYNNSNNNYSGYHNGSSGNNSSNRNRPHQQQPHGGSRVRPHYRPHNYYNSGSGSSSRGRPYNHHYGRRRDYPPPPSGGHGGGGGGYR